MIRLFEPDGKTAVCILSELAAASLSGEVNGDQKIRFSLPRACESSALIKSGMVIDADGTRYKILYTASDAEKISAEGLLEGIYAAKKIHVQNIPDMMGVKPSEVLEKIFADTDITVLKSVDGMEMLDDTGILIDYFSADKQTAFDAMKSVTELCGFGEMYFDGMSAALVTRIGRNTGRTFSFAGNIRVIKRETDASQLVTRLYPYGKADLHIGSVNGGVQYIDSENISKYGVIEGYMNFSDVTSAARLLDMASFKFSAQNSDRIDVPSETLTIEIENSGGYVPEAGDRIILVNEDGAVEGEKRIISYEYMPLDGTMSLTLGRVRRDLYYFLKEFKSGCDSYDKVSDKSGSVMTSCLSGDISTDTNKVISGNGYFSIDRDLMTVKNGSLVRLRIGNRDGVFGFSVYDKNGNEVIALDDDGGATFSGTVSTEKDAVIGDRLSLGNVSERPTVLFYGMDNTLMAKISAYPDSDGVYAVNISTEKKSGDAGRVYINGSLALTADNLAGAISDSPALAAAIRNAIS